MIIQSRRDEFWRALNTKLLTRDLEPATNIEVDDVIRRTTCPRQAAEFVALTRTGRHPGN
jgi:hypothetical protein